MEVSQKDYYQLIVNMLITMILWNYYFYDLAIMPIWYKMRHSFCHKYNVKHITSNKSIVALHNIMYNRLEPNYVM